MIYFGSVHRRKLRFHRSSSTFKERRNCKHESTQEEWGVADIWHTKQKGTFIYKSTNVFQTLIWTRNIVRNTLNMPRTRRNERKTIHWWEHSTMLTWERTVGFSFNAQYNTDHLNLAKDSIFTWRFMCIN